MDAVATMLANNRGARDKLSPQLKDKHIQRLRTLRQRLQALAQLRTWSPAETGGAGGLGNVAEGSVDGDTASIEGAELNRLDHLRTGHGGLAREPSADVSARSPVRNSLGDGATSGRGVSEGREGGAIRGGAIDRDKGFDVDAGAPTVGRVERMRGGATGSGNDNNSSSSNNNSQNGTSGQPRGAPSYLGYRDTPTTGGHGQKNRELAEEPGSQEPNQRNSRTGAPRRVDDEGKAGGSGGTPQSKRVMLGGGKGVDTDLALESGGGTTTAPSSSWEREAGISAGSPDQARANTTTARPSDNRRSQVQTSR